MKVLFAAWAGSTDHASAASPDDRASSDGRFADCARCATRGVGEVPVRQVISKSFTGYDGWSTPAGSHLCAVCAWSYTNPRLRQVPHLIRRDPAHFVEQSLASVAERLCAGALDCDVALVVPLRPGRKHLLPDAAWGRVAVDDAQLPWSIDDAARLQAVIDLRTSGFGTRMLRDPAPAYQVLRSLPPQRWQQVLSLWGRLAAWRTTANPWLELALRITTPQRGETR